MLLMPHEVSPDSPRRRGDATAAPLQPTTGGRVAVGTVLALGFYLGMRKVAIGVVYAAIPDPSAWWLSFHGLVAVYAAQMIAVVFGAVMAAAGRPKGFGHGLLVGVVCGGLFLAFELLAGVPPKELVLYLQPPVLALLGLVAGVVGARVWAASPILNIPIPNPSKLSSIILAPESTTNPGKPTVWVRVIFASLLMVGGAATADQIKTYAQKYSMGALRVQSRGQSEFISCQIATFAILCGGILAGAGTGAGVRHGLIAGGIGGLGVLGVCFRYGAPIPPVEYWLGCISLGDDLITAPVVWITILASVVGVSLIGGWMGGALFLPVVPAHMRGRLRIND
jgi:hypothetical protein